MPSASRRITLNNLNERITNLESSVILLTNRCDELTHRELPNIPPLFPINQDPVIPDTPFTQFSSSSLTLNNPPSLNEFGTRSPSSNLGIAPNSARAFSPPIYFSPAVHRACMMESQAFDELRDILRINPVLERAMTMLRYLHITIRGYNDIAELLPLFSTELGHGVQRATDSYNLLLELIEHPSGALALPDTAINFIYPIPAVSPTGELSYPNFSPVQHAYSASPIPRPLPIPPIPTHIPRVPVDTLADSTTNSSRPSPEPIGTGRPTPSLPGARPPTRSRDRLESSDDERSGRRLRRETRRVRPRRVPVPRTDTPIPHLSGPGVPPLNPPIVFGDFPAIDNEASTAEIMRRVFYDSSD